MTIERSTPTPAAAQRRWRLLALLAIAVFAANAFATGQANRGRWDLNEHIAMADRVAAGGNYYTNGRDSLYASSSPYFPGVTFIAQAVNAVTRGQADTVMLIVASLVFLAYLVVLGMVGRRLGLDFWQAVIGAAFLARFCLPDWFGYAVEFKPDTLALLAGTVIVLLLAESRLWLGTLIAIFILNVVAVVSKQQYLLFYAGLFPFVIWSRYPVGTRRKATVVAVLIASGVTAILLLLSLDNLYSFAIDANQHRSRQPLRSAAQQVLFLYDCWPFVVATLGYAIVHGRQSLRDWRLMTRERGFAFWYAVVAALWLAMSLRSAINVGGNIGNVAVGFAPLIPFAIVLALSVTRKDYHQGLFIGLALVLAAASAKDLAKSLVQYRRSQARDREIVSYLGDHFRGKSVLNDGDGYILVRKAGLSHKTELDTVAHLILAGKDVTPFTAAVEAERFEVVLVYGTEMDYWIRQYPLVFFAFKKHYVALQDPANPLKGGIFIPAGVK